VYIVFFVVVLSDITSPWQHYNQSTHGTSFPAQSHYHLLTCRKWDCWHQRGM